MGNVETDPSREAGRTPPSFLGTFVRNIAGKAASIFRSSRSTSEPAMQTPALSDEERHRMWDEWLTRTLTTEQPEFDAAEAAFFRDLPELLNTVGEGTWVAYTGLGMVAKGKTKLSTYSKIEKLELPHGAYTIRRVDQQLLHPYEIEIG